MNVSTTHEKILKMVQIAFLAAIEVVLTLLYIPIGTINLNFGLVPIVISGVLLGPAVGGLIGAVSGVVTMTQVLTGQGVFYAFLVAENPLVASLLCIVKTGAAGIVSGLVYKLFSKIEVKPYHKRATRIVGSAVSGAVCAIVNTGIFALGMLTIFGNGLMAHPEISAWTSDGLFALVFLVLIGINFPVEVVSTVVLTPPVNEALFASNLIKKKK